MGISQTVTITYKLPTGCIATIPVVVHPIPPSITGTTHACEGLSAHLFDITPGGIWSSGNTTISIVDPVTGIVTGILAGATTISYTVLGCPAVTSFTVNPLPGPITGSPIACIGLTNTLSAAIAGGIWNSGNPPVERGL